MTLPPLAPGLRPLSAYLEAASPLMEALETGGLSPSGATEAAICLQLAAQSLVDMDLSPTSPVAGSFVPGRVELLGKHVDYAGGRSLLLAVEKGFSVVAGELGPDRPGIHIVAAHRGERMLWSGSGGSKPLPGQPSEGEARPGEVRPDWYVYPRTLLSRLESDFPEVTSAACRQGVVVAFASSLPQAAGMSSSSAFLIALFLGIVSGLPQERATEVLGGFVSREQLAEYLSAVESGRPTPRLGPPVEDGPRGGQASTPGVGTEGGSQDHVAILCARPHEVVQYRFLPPTDEGRVPWPGDWRLVVASSGVRAEKVAGAQAGYNRLAREARQAGELTTESGRLGELLFLGQEGWKAAAELARSRAREGGGSLAARIQQFTTESGELVPAALKAVREVDALEWGRVVGRSQLLAREVLRNQVPETDFLVHQAQVLGASAASAFGAGFGGSVWAMATSEESQARLVVRWRQSYHARFPQRAPDSRFMDVCPGPAAFYLFGSPDGEAPWGP
ncbi:MAG: galactokinase family protein [Gemmatimonadota bacterium]